MSDSNADVNVEPIPAGGPGAERFDQPALFYLTHQATIDEWHGLRHTVSEALNGWFESTVRDALGPLASDHGLVVSFAQGPSRNSHLVLHPPNTPVLGRKPVAGVGVAWHADSANPISNQPFACLRCSRTETGRAAAAMILENGGREFRSAHGAKGRDTETWPVWTYIKADDRWWTHLDVYLAAILGEVTTYVEGLASALAIGATVEVRGSADED
jgi:hypothetical protein